MAGKIALEKYLGASATGLLSLAARGVWAELCLWMWAESPERGRLMHATGMPMSTGQFARLLRTSERELGRLLGEIVDAGLAVREGEALVCPEMVRDAELSAKRSRAGRRGGVAKASAKPIAKANAMASARPNAKASATANAKANAVASAKAIAPPSSPLASSPLHPPSSLPASPPCCPPSESPRGGATPSGAVVAVPLVDGSEWAVTEEMVEEWEEAYPRVDVRQELRSLRQWNLSNPRKRKTPRGIRKHVTDWLARVQNSGRGALRGVAGDGSGSGGQPAGPVAAGGL